MKYITVFLEKKYNVRDFYKQGNTYVSSWVKETHKSVLWQLSRQQNQNK